MTKQLTVYFVDANNLTSLKRFCRIFNKYSPGAYVFIANSNLTTFNPLLWLCQTFNSIIQNMKQKQIIVDSTVILAELAECRELLKRTLCLLIGHLILLLFVDGKHPLGKDFFKTLNCGNAPLTAMNMSHKQKLFEAQLARKSRISILTVERLTRTPCGGSSCTEKRQVCEPGFQNSQCLLHGAGVTLLLKGHRGKGNRRPVSLMNIDTNQQRTR